MTDSCPLPISDHDRVLLGHGGGGRLMQDLLSGLFFPAFSNPLLDVAHDGAVFPTEAGRWAFTTDSHVVHPLFFPGGDIGTLAVCGTVNDLAMCGARPRYLSIGFIIEEGLSMKTLGRVVESIRATAERIGVQLVTGDTKVVDRGKGDGLFLNTAGVGEVPEGRDVRPRNVEPGNAILVSGDVGRHGMAVMAVREGLAFESDLLSDCGPVNDRVEALFDAGVPVLCLRDLTRGGLVSALVEIARTAGVRIRIEESAVPVEDTVRGACEILGLDPFYVASEGRFVLFCPEDATDPALEVLGPGAARIGTVKETAPTGRVEARTPLGARRVLDLLSGQQLPRIC